MVKFKAFDLLLEFEWAVEMSAFSISISKLNLASELLDYLFANIQAESWTLMQVLRAEFLQLEDIASHAAADASSGVYDLQW